MIRTIEREREKYSHLQVIHMFYTFIWKSIIKNCFVLIKQLEILFFNQNKRTKQINFKFLFLKLFQLIFSFLFEWLYLGNHQHFIKHARRKNNNYQQKKKLNKLRDSIIF